MKLTKNKIFSGILIFGLITNLLVLFDIQYRANYTYIYMYRIDVTNGEIVKDFRMGWYPNSTVRFQF